MEFAGLNFLAVVVAAVVSFLFGAVWYVTLSRQWMQAVGKTEAELKDSGRPLPLLLAMSFAALLVMAWVLAGLIGHLGEGQVTLWNGLISGVFVWLGFVITTLATSYAYQGANWSLTFIDGAHWLGVLLLQGAIIGFLGVG